MTNLATTMRLWIENSGLASDEIRSACAAAESAIYEAGFTVQEAYEASLAECDGRDYDPAAFAAWGNAESIALENVADERAILSVA